LARQHQQTPLDDARGDRPGERAPLRTSMRFAHCHKMIRTRRVPMPRHRQPPARSVRDRRWLVGAVVAFAAASTPIAAAYTAPRVTLPPNRGSVAVDGHGTAPQQRASRSAETVITYHGGPLMLGTPNVYFIWYGDWAGNTAQTILPD